MLRVCTYVCVSACPLRVAGEGAARGGTDGERGDGQLSARAWLLTNAAASARTLAGGLKTIRLRPFQLSV